MHTIIIGASIGVGWIAISYAMESLFPMGDWRWFVVAAIAFGTAAVFWMRRSDRLRRPFLKTHKPDIEQVKRLQALSTVARAIRERAMENPILDKMVDEVLKKEESVDSVSMRKPDNEEDS